MCGIVGFLDRSLQDSGERDAVLEFMRRAIVHRGPDDAGQVSAACIGLGMQRLSIVDLEHGQQPMRSPTRRIWLVFNGEIYNHADLRRELEAGGRAFRTSCDTEVILALYEAHGLAGIERLNGMFAVAIWDEDAGQLHLVRDRLGVKPLYYYFDGARLYFASEIKALLASGRIETEINPQAIWDYLTFRYVPAPQTIWKNIHKLPPAHTLTVEIAQPAIASERYWDMPYAEPAARQEAGGDWLEAFTALFEDAVQIRMVADVPVGIMLSGGIDSSAVAAAVDRERFPDLKTFSVTFEDAGDANELAFAREAAAHLGTDHHECTITQSDFCGFLDDLVYYTDEPLADLASVPLYFLACTAREQVKVVLSGEGSDEILAGYTFDQVQEQWDAIEAEDEVAPMQVRSLTGRFKSLLQVAMPFPKQVVPRRVDLRQQEAPLHITNFLSSEAKRTLFRAPADWPDSNEVLRRDLSRVRTDEPLGQALYLYAQNWLVEDLLMKADKMTMANSLELRTPFLDYRLVEWAARSPASVKLRKKPGGGYVTKAVLREYARTRLPETILNRPKQGFPIPVYDWLSTRLKPLANDLLGTGQCKVSRWFQPDGIRGLLDKGTSTAAGSVDRHNLWNLLVLEQWARHWV